jgi:hypothetical protein
MKENLKIHVRSMSLLSKTSANEPLEQNSAKSDVLKKMVVYKSE